MAQYGARGYVAGNGILVPRSGRSKLACAMGWVRALHDLAICRFSLGAVRRPIFGMQDEHIIVRGDVLREARPAMGDAVTEDFRLAVELLKWGYNSPNYDQGPSKGPQLPPPRAEGRLGGVLQLL